jgi:hypothetical protein
MKKKKHSAQCRPSFWPEAFARHLAQWCFQSGWLVLTNTQGGGGVRPGMVTVLSVTGVARSPSTA